MQIKKERVVEYDIAKGIAILGVMMVHIPFEYRLIKYGIAFHIVVFFAITGILEDKHSTEVSLGNYIKKKTIMLNNFFQILQKNAIINI